MVATSFSSRNEQQVRAWFFLARPGVTEPWKDHVYQSQTIQKAVPAGSPVVFYWSEAVRVPDGMYELTVWFHRQVGDSWVHADGGAFGLPPIVIRAGSIVTSVPATKSTES